MDLRYHTPVVNLVALIVTYFGYGANNSIDMMKRCWLAANWRESNITWF